MSAPVPVVYLFHGEDEFGIAQEIANLQAKLGDEATRELNTTLIEEASFSLGAVEAVTATIPFLASRRLVILKNPLVRLNKKSAQEQFLQLLERIPPETALVIQENHTLKGDHWLIRWARSAPERVYIRPYPLPQGQLMARWIRSHAEKEGGAFTLQAAAYLASLVGSHTRFAAQEANKMLAYVGYARPVDVDDVQLLYAPVEQEDVSQIFQMVDALGNREGSKAFQLLRQLSQIRDPLSLFGMIVRQFRLILLAREISERGGDAQAVRDALKLHDFVARKIVSQARNFDLQTLEAIYHRLLELDEQIKSGQIDPDTGLDTLIAGLTTDSHSHLPAH